MKDNTKITLTVGQLKRLVREAHVTYQECPDSVKKDIESDIVDFIEEDKIWDPDVSFSFDVERGTASIDVHGGSKAYGDSYTIHKWATGRYNPHNKTYRIVDARYRRRTRGGGFGDGERDWRDDDPLKLCNIVKQAFNDASLTPPASISISINVYYD